MCMERLGRTMADQKKQINVELRDEEAEGIYANFAAITHSPAEFVMDFIRVLPGTKKSRVHARIVMAPQNVKAFVRALQDKSDTRRTDSEVFCSYTNLLNQLDTMNKVEELPLSLEKRLAQARKRRDLLDEQKKIVKEKNGDDERTDLVLDEAMHILSDFVDLARIPRNQDNKQP